MEREKQRVKEKIETQRVRKKEKEIIEQITWQLNTHRLDSERHREISWKIFWGRLS